MSISQNYRKQGHLVSPDAYSPVELSSSEAVSANSKLLSMTVPPRSVFPVPLPIWSMYVKDSDIQVERPYTPLKGLSKTGALLFWIKKYPHGEVGRWLHNKAPGDLIEVKGPSQTWKWEDDVWDRVIMIAGGTGITPFYQLLHYVFGEVKPKLRRRTSFRILQCYRSPSDLPPDFIMTDLMKWAEDYPNQIAVRTFVDGSDGSENTKDLIVRRIALDDIKSEMKHDPSQSDKTLILVSGPEGMIAAIAGPRGRNFSQGRVAGLLGMLNDREFTVWKL